MDLSAPVPGKSTHGKEDQELSARPGVAGRAGALAVGHPSQPAPWPSFPAGLTSHFLPFLPMWE